MELHPVSAMAPADPTQSPANSSKPARCASARMEFQASLQLLAERASFLTAATGVAIALAEGSSVSYCAAIGSNVPLAGNAVGTSEPAIKDCTQKRRVVRVAAGSQFKLLVPIATEEKAVGFFEVVSKYEWTDQDADAVTRLADLAVVAFEHRVAAETAEAQPWQALQEQPSPVAWHAPQESDLAPGKESKTEPVKITTVNMCAACGFPVSTGRNLCVECEQQSDTPVPAAPELFSTQNQESWISEHGYTVASLIVSALAAAIIFWLRR